MAVSHDTIDWLLAGDACIRWQTKRDLLSLPVEDYEADRLTVATTGWGHRLLSYQDTDGSWGGQLYSGKWTSTTYSLLLLRRMGLDQGHLGANAAVELLWDGARYFDDGLTVAQSIDAPEACVTSMYLALATYFGFADERVEAATQWLLDNQLDDGGWNCRTVRFGDRHSSFHTSIMALEALAEIDRSTPGRTEIADALTKGSEFFLDHRLYKSHRTGQIVSAAFTRFSFPPRWHYDALRGLEHFANTSAPLDKRLDDALALLHSRQRKDGRWPVQNKHAGKVWFDMEKVGRPSRWNTLRSLRVLAWAGERL